uniref:DNA/RNA non-specific endonuclease n=1 Tax=Parendozoicomonas sp. Alg238-R29 TaxID=2993446 RepID=UPI00248D8CAB
AFGEAWDLANFLWEDELSQRLVILFAKDYARAQHSLEMAELAGSAAFEILLTIVLAAVTGGAGAAVKIATTAGTKTQLMARLAQVGKLFDKVAELRRGKRPPRPKNLQSVKGSGSSLADYEVEGSAYSSSEPPKADKKPTRKTIQETHGTNRATWTVDEAGRPISVEATLDSTYGSTRSKEEKSLQRKAGGDARLPDDDGGHAIGHRFMSDQGEKNLFPQNSNLNRSAYKKMENEWADWADEGFEVQLKVELHPSGAERPTDIVAKYSVIDPATRKPVFKRRERFKNAPGESFERVAKADMKSYR